MHVGVAKTGTTYLQRVLFAHREVLRAGGVLYPGTEPGDQYVASVDLRGLRDARFSHLNVDGMWDRIVAEVQEFDATALISHETFARCTIEEAAQVAEAFDGAQLKVVLTLRDLGRQVPAVWQETLKNKSTLTYDDFLSLIFTDLDSGTSKFFWKAQDVKRVVKRWGSVVGMDNVTIVTVPPSGAPRDELWNRFAEAVELPDLPIELPEGAANSSLGPAEAELLRFINLSLPAGFPWPRYMRLINHKLAEVRLAGHSTSRIVVPEEWHTAVTSRATMMVDYFAASGVKVVGDLEDLTPVLPVHDVSGPADLDRDELMSTAADIIRDLVLAPPPPALRPPPAPVPEAGPLDGLRALARRAIPRPTRDH